MLSLSSKKSRASALAATFLSAAIATSAFPVSNAQAGHIYGVNNHGWNQYYGQRHQVRKYKRRKKNRRNINNNGGELFAAGIVGLAIGTIIADSANMRAQRVDNLYYELPSYAPPREVNAYQYPYYADQDYSYDSRPAALPSQYPDNNYAYGSPAVNKAAEPKVVTYEEAMAGGALPEPWSSEWLSYCRSKFHSFDDETGTYLGFDNRRHFCVPK
jgi:hypothetical protein